QPESQGQPPLPSDFEGIRPGSLILTTFAGSPDLFVCTLGFILRDQATGRYLASTAGHCLIPEGKRATHGSDADWNPADTSVLVCASTCVFGGELALQNTDLRPL